MTTASYNKWHGVDTPCPLCKNTGITQFHLILECPITNEIWEDLTPVLIQIQPIPVTDEEKVFGILKNDPKTQLRNWLTFLLREVIIRQELIAYHNKRGRTNIRDMKIYYNARVQREVRQAQQIYTNIGRADIFVRRYAPNNAFLTAREGRIEDEEIPLIF